MKTEAEITNIHDLFCVIRLGQVPNPWAAEPDNVPPAVLMAILDTLCWVLEHPDCAALQKKINYALRFMELQGYAPYSKRRIAEGRPR